MSEKLFRTFGILCLLLSIASPAMSQEEAKKPVPVEVTNFPEPQNSYVPP